MKKQQTKQQLDLRQYTRVEGQKGEDGSREDDVRGQRQLGSPPCVLHPAQGLVYM